MNKYAKITTFDADGDVLREYAEPLSIEHIKVAIESELTEDAEVGEEIRISVVEMSEEEFETFNEGY